MTIVASLLFLMGLTLCAIISLSTLASYSHRIIDIIMERNALSEKPPTIRIGATKHYTDTNITQQNVIAKTILTDNIFTMPLLLTNPLDVDVQYDEAA